jgi:hypothetical protein
MLCMDDAPATTVTVPTAAFELLVDGLEKLSKDDAGYLRICAWTSGRRWSPPLAGRLGSDDERQPETSP